MKSIARILATGCIVALAASAYSQTKPAAPVAIPHHTDAEWAAIVGELSNEVQTEHANYLRSSMDFNNYKLDELTKERQGISTGMESMIPGSHWDERSRSLQMPQAPSPAPQAPVAAPKNIATPPTPASAPTPTPTVGKATAK